MLVKNFNAVIVKVYYYLLKSNIALHVH